MKKILLTLTLTSLLVLPVLALGQTIDTPPEVAPTLITTAGGFLELIERIGNWIFVFLLAIAAVFLIVAGFLWATAGGNPENVNKARQMLINALIGVAIALLARGLIMVIKGIVGA